MAHMAPRTFAINPGTLAIPVLPSKILPQRVAESVQQIRFAANGVRLPTQSLDQIDERVFLLFHAVEEHRTERHGIAVHLPGLQTAGIVALGVILDRHGTIAVLQQHEIKQLAAGPPVAVHERVDVLEHRMEPAALSSG